MISDSILILGASGLVGNMLYRVLSENPTIPVYGIVRSESSKEFFISSLSNNMICVSNIFSIENILKLFELTKPSIVINCISVGRPIPNDYSCLIPVLSIFPRRLSYLCKSMNIRLINISSDGVFSGKQGNYCEIDTPDAEDAYGCAKLLGEVPYDALTFRTSFIGPELNNKFGLLEWVISQTGECTGYPFSVFSGVTTLEFGKFLRDIVIPCINLKGLFHVASTPCSKFDLLKMIKAEYDLDIKVIPDTSLSVNRSLNAGMLKALTGYSPPTWGEMLHSLREYNFGLRDI